MNAMNSNSKPTAETSRGSLLTMLPLSLLTWLEIRALNMEYASLVRQSKGDDRWFVFCDGGTAGPVRLQEVLQQLVNGQSSLAILHGSATQQAEPKWRSMSYHAWNQNAVTSTLWIFSFWTLAVFYGWILVALLLPASLREYGGAAYVITLAVLVGREISRGLRKTRRRTPRGEEVAVGNALDT